ncbi:MAG TPA: WG repeat-containing protein, partial [Cytophagaceae bacterium]
QNITIGEDMRKVFLISLLFILHQSFAIAQNLLPIKRNYKWGFIDSKGEIKINPQFDYVQEFEGRYSKVLIAHKQGLIDTTGNLIIPAQYEELRVLKDSLFTYKKGNYWGLINIYNEELLSAKFDQIDTFRFPLLKLVLNNKSGLYNYRKDLLLTPIYDTIKPLNSELTYIINENKQGVVNDSLSKVLSAQYEKIVVLNSNAVLYQKNGLWGVSDKKGRIVLQPIYKNYRASFDNFIQLQNESLLWELYSVDQKKVINDQGYDAYHFLSPDLLITINGVKKGLITSSGTIIQEPVWDDVWTEEGENVIRVKQNELIGFLSKIGKLLVSPQYTFLSDFRDDVAVVFKDNKYGLINSKGKVLTQPVYVNIEPADLAYKCISSDNGMDYISYDEDGNFIEKINYKNYRSISIYQRNQNSQVQFNRFRSVGPSKFGWVRNYAGLWGWKDSTGKFKVKPAYNDIQVDSASGLTLVMIRVRNVDKRRSVSFDSQLITKYGLVNHNNGVIVINPIFLNIVVDDFKTGLYARCILESGKYALISRTGNFIHGYEYKDKGRLVRGKIGYIGVFQNGVARINLDGTIVYTGYREEEVIPAIAPHSKYRQISCSGGKWGYIDMNGKIIIEPEYDYARDFFNDKAIVKKGKKYGVITKENSFVLTPDYDFIDYLEGSDNKLFRLTNIKNKYGYLTKEGKVIVNPGFEKAGFFREGLASVRDENKWGYIDTSGVLVISPEYEKVSEFNEGLAAVMINRKWGFIDRQGKMVIEPQFSSAGDFHEGRAWVKQKNKVGYINQSGNYIIPPKYIKADNFKNGVAIARIKKKYGLIDAKGKWIGRPCYKSISEFENNSLAIVRKGKRYGVIDNRGKKVIPVKYNKIGGFSEGVTMIRKKKKFGFADSTGKITIKPYYQNAGNFSEGLARVKMNGIYGYINKNNQFVIAPKFFVCKDFSNGRAEVTERGRKGYIDRNGNWIVNPKYHKAEPYNSCLGLVARYDMDGNKYFYLDTTGTNIFKYEFSNATSFNNGLATVEKDGAWGLLNEKGIVLTDFKFGGIGEFIENKAAFWVVSFSGVASEEGKILIPLEYERVKYFASSNSFQLQRGDEIGYFTATGQWLWEPKK